MAGNVAQYDSALLGILQNEGNIGNFLQVMFGFLFRRTDFYIIMKSEKDKLGFPPGAAEKLVLQHHRFFQKLAAERDTAKEIIRANAAAKKSGVEITDVTEEKNVEMGVSGESNTNNAQKGINVITEPDSDTHGIPTGTLSSSSDTTSGGEQPADTVPKNTCVTNPEPEEEDDSEISRQQKVYQADPECYNGAVRDNYSWSQSITDIDVRVNVPKSIIKGKQCEVSIDKKHIKVGYKDSNNEVINVVDEDLTWDIQKEESMWSLVPGEHVHLNLEKKEERWWEGLLVNEPKINVRKIDCSRSITDLDEEAQNKISEMMYNEQQKKMGLPQSHEQKTYDMMKQAWNAEGSPFKGQPFDPSKISVNPGGVVSINDPK